MSRSGPEAIGSVCTRVWINLGPVLEELLRPDAVLVARREILADVRDMECGTGWTISGSSSSTNMGLAGVPASVSVMDDDISWSEAMNLSQEHRL